MSYRGVEIPNQLAQYGQLAQIQNAQNQNRMANLQVQEYERAREEEEGTRNFLRGRDLASPETRSGLAQFGKTGLAYSKLLQEQEAAALNTKNVQSQINERDFTTQDKKLKFAWNAVGSASTPQAAIAELTKGVKDKVFDMKSASAEIQQLQNMTPDQYQQYRVQKVMGILDAKDKLGFMLPKVARQDVGGQIVNIQDNPAMQGYGMPVQGMAPIKKTPTIADTIAQGRLGVEQQRLAQDATGVVYQEDANGNVIALPSKLKKGEVPTARIAVAPGGGFQPLQGKPSEAVGKEQMSINQQRAIVKGAIDAATTTPDAFGMSRGLMGETLGGRMGSSQENQARSYLFNVVSGVIKERAGTAQSAAEAETLARFLPQPTDNADTIVDKMTAFDKYLVAKETGTTKKRGGADKPPLAPMDQEALKWANSNPADPRAAAIKQRLGM
jgi:hypothetical protein